MWIPTEVSHAHVPEHPGRSLADFEQCFKVLNALLAVFFFSHQAQEVRIPDACDRKTRPDTDSSAKERTTGASLRVCNVF